MNVKEIFEGLADPARREEAAAELRAELGRIADSALASAGADERDDAVQRVALKLWTMVERGAAGKISGWGYLRRMLINSHYNAWRKDKTRRERELSAGQRVFGEGSLAPGSPEAAAAKVREQLERLVETAVAARRRNREDLRRVAEQIIDLEAGITTMDQVLRDEGVEHDTEPAERKRIVDRVLQRHCRARRELREAVERLEASGDLSVDEKADLLEICRHLKCQKRSHAGV